MAGTEEAGAREPSIVEVGGWPSVLGRLVAGESLSSEQARAAMFEILCGRASDAQIAAFATALRSKGETVEELCGLVSAMSELAEPLVVEGVLVDTCGTGGDGSMSINVSTIAALIAAGAGARVCKHGGRSASSRCGSADVLEALGVVIDLGPGGVRRCIDEAGMGFCFAQRFHPAMRHAAPVRRELGVPTVFNLLGPLVNPARAARQVIGVADPGVAHAMIGVLEAKGAERAMVVHGDDGLDELSTTSLSSVVELTLTGDGGRKTSEYSVDPGTLGFERAEMSSVRGGHADYNAEVVRRVLAGDRGPERDIAVLNAAAAIVVAGLSPDLAGGVLAAQASIDDGSAGRVLEALVAASRSAAADEGR